MRSYDSTSGIQRDIVSSVGLIYKVFRHIQDHNLSIGPNDCTLLNMQMQGVNTHYKEYFDNEQEVTFDDFMQAIVESIPEERLLLDREP